MGSRGKGTNTLATVPVWYSWASWCHCTLSLRREVHAGVTELRCKQLRGEGGSH